MNCLVTSARTGEIKASQYQKALFTLLQSSKHQDEQQLRIEDQHYWNEIVKAKKSSH